MSLTALPVVETDPVAEEETAATATWYAFRHNPLGLAALALLGLLLLIPVAAPLLAAYPTGYSTAVLVGPSATHLFGTDSLGRDVFAEVVWGTRISMTVGACASALAIGIGVLVGMLGAYFPKVDVLLRLVVDLSLSLPVLPLMILVAAVAGPSLPTIIVVISFFS